MQEKCQAIFNIGKKSTLKGNAIIFYFYVNIGFKLTKKLNYNYFRKIRERNWNIQELNSHLS